MVLNAKLKAYRKDYCEACYKPAMGMPHHIKSRGAGGSDEPENLLQLCGWCHHYIHTVGATEFLRCYPHLREKVLKARPALAAVMIKEGK